MTTLTMLSVLLVEASAQTVYVTGEVRGPGAQPYLPNLTLAQAVAASGGVTIRGLSRDVRLLRINKNGLVQTYRINLKATMHDSQPDFMLLPGDIVYVQTSSVADVNDWIDLYIRRMIPLPGVVPIP